MVRFRAVLARTTVWNIKVRPTKGSLAPHPGITLRGEGAPTVHTPPLRVILAQITNSKVKVRPTKGSLAPSPGITLRGEGSTNGAHSSSTRHIKVRPTERSLAPSP